MELASRLSRGSPKKAAASSRWRRGSARKSSMLSWRILLLGMFITNSMRFSHASAMRLGKLSSLKAVEVKEYVLKTLPFTSRASYCSSGKRSCSRARTTVRWVFKLLYMKTALADSVDLSAGRMRRSARDRAFTMTVCSRECRRESTDIRGDFQSEETCFDVALLKVSAVQASNGGSRSTRVPSTSASARESSVEPVWPRWNMKCSPSPAGRPPTGTPRSMPQVASSWSWCTGTK
mmetsp:Transcript_13150/g.41485  ORF Transcript_13150/g.41485 Transcript_13150/m.41485 type:complete len:235 (+) Transcript_13150:223-927(+)